MKLLSTLALLGLITLSYSDYLPGQGSVFIDGQEYRPVQNDYISPPSTAPTPSQSNTVAHEQCWYEQIPLNDGSTEETANVGGAIVGGIIGAVIGHQFGSGSGNTAATIGGAAIGTALGAGSGQPAAQRYQTVRKCNTIR